MYNFWLTLYLLEGVKMIWSATAFYWLYRGKVEPTLSECLLIYRLRVLYVLCVSLGEQLSSHPSQLYRYRLQCSGPKTCLGHSVRSAYCTARIVIVFIEALFMYVRSNYTLVNISCYCWSLALYMVGGFLLPTFLSC